MLHAVRGGLSTQRFETEAVNAKIEARRLRVGSSVSAFICIVNIKIHDVDNSCIS